MLCNHDCDSCPARAGNSLPAFCLVMNAEIKASRAKEEYYDQKKAKL